MFQGSMVALVTPMTNEGQIDIAALNELIEWHISASTAALVIAGTTGESATLTIDERDYLLKHCVKQAARRIPIIAGTGTNSTATTIKLTEQAKAAGVEASLIVTPYYNKPTQAGLIAHYKSVAAAVDLPIILYNVPTRTACDLLPETVATLSHVKHIIGIKEATGHIDRTEAILSLCPPHFLVWSGDDPSALTLMTKGAKGVISVTANVAPEKMAKMCDFALKGQIEAAELINSQLELLHHKLFVEANPIPVKWALTQMGKIKAGIRLPLLPLDKHYHKEVKEALRAAGI